ncbi:MAG TPA: hypothetical protein VJ952_09015 [Opitutales bacterium]|nr:hypothetical protein [Opitutales bacterium]
MKPQDPLDQKIDELLARQPVKASDDFAARTLAEAEAQDPRKQPGGLAPLIRFVLPLAAALALAAILVSQFGKDPASSPAALVQDSTSATTTAASQAALDAYELQELLLLQEGLSGFAQIETDDLSTGDLLATLDTLHSI